MLNINQRLQQVFEDAIRAACPQVADPPLAVTPGRDPKFGDYQCNSAMALGQVGCQRVCVCVCVVATRLGE